MVAPSIHDTCYIQLHSNIHKDNHKSFISFSNLYMGSVNMNKLMDLFYSLANCEHRHICLFNVRLNSKYRIMFYSKTYKSLNLQCNYESTWLEFIINNEHMHKIICMDILKLNWANEYKNIFYSFVDDIAFIQVNGNQYSYLHRGIFVLFL